MRGDSVRANVCQDDYQADNSKTEKRKKKADSDSDTDLSEFYKPTFTMSNKTNVKYELEFHWLYYSNRKKGYMCKYCEVFSGTVCHSGKEQLAFIDYGVVS